VATVAYSEVHKALRAAVPDFGSVIDQHIGAHDGVLPHVLFGDLTRFVLDAHERADAEVEQRCLEFLDHALKEGDELVQNLVAVSFVENVGPWDAEMAGFIASWPDALRSEATRQREWRRGNA
jgi:hypothetical protein